VGIERFGIRSNWLRSDRDESEKVSFVELFFDLVFVFAITQVSHTFVNSIDGGDAALGALQAIIVLLAVWWVWVYTVWTMNWLDPDRGPVRWMLLVLMLFGLVMSTSIPEAFGDRALLFVCAYVIMQIGRATFTVVAMLRFHLQNSLNVIRLTIWFMVSAVFWFGGVAVEDSRWRLLLWGIAIVIEYSGPAALYWVPVMGRSSLENIPIRGGHIAERAALFVIIAIGESVLVTGAAFAEHPIDAAGSIAFLASFVGSILLWLLYFSRAEGGGSRFIKRHAVPSQIASTSYTYIHVVLVAGIVFTAVADELVLAHPTGAAEPLTVALCYGAPLLYLAGNLIFKRSVGAPWLVSHLVGIAALVVLGAGALIAGPAIPAVVHSWIANVVLAGVVIGEDVGWRRTWLRPAPEPEDAQLG
jgi:low temperature requirement protein LtrA